MCRSSGVGVLVAGVRGAVGQSRWCRWCRTGAGVGLWVGAAGGVGAGVGTGVGADKDKGTCTNRFAELWALLIMPETALALRADSTSAAEFKF